MPEEKCSHRNGKSAEAKGKGPGLLHEPAPERVRAEIGEGKEEGEEGEGGEGGC